MNSGAQRILHAAAAALVGATLMVQQPTATATALPAAAEPGPAPFHTETVLDHALSTPVVFDHHLYFSSQDAAHGWELWRSDGSAAGTKMLKDVKAGPGSSRPTGMVAAGDKLFFFADTGPGTDLWATDGTRSGTMRVKRSISIDTYDVNAAAVGDDLLFFANDPERGRSLFRSDGTAAGTVVLKDHLTWGWDFHHPEVDELAVLDGKLLFTGSDGVHGPELWRSDGTRRGTRLVKDIHPGDGDDGPTGLTVAGDTLFFTANDSTHGRELWKSDGTRAGTALVKDIVPLGTSGWPEKLTAVADTLYFTPGGAGPAQLWKSDGTEVGTAEVTSFTSADSSPAHPNGVWSLAAVGDTLMLSTGNSADGAELWKSDGTQEGTVQVTDFDPNPCPDACTGTGPIVGVGSTAFLVAGQLSLPRVLELWVSDGTEEGTTRVESFSPVHRYDPAVDEFTEMDGTLYFTARDGVFIEHLMKVADGPAAGPTCHGYPATVVGAGSITGTPGRDVIVGSDGDDVIDGGGGDDTICAGAGADTLTGGDGNDVLDLVDGVSGNDSADGGAGYDEAVIDPGDVLTSAIYNDGS